jgi:hypothetical protein
MSVTALRLPKKESLNPAKSLLRAPILIQQQQRIALSLHACGGFETHMTNNAKQKTNDKTK